MAEQPNVSGGADILYENHHKGEATSFHMILTSDCFLSLQLTGKGTVDGVKILLAAFDEGQALLPPDGVVTGFVDLRGLDGAPLRAELMLGKWLFKRRNLAKRIAIFGGKPFEMAMARTVMKIARIDRVGFFKAEAEAKSWLHGM